MAKNYVGDVGLAVVLETGVDLAAATGCAILVRRPDGSEVEWSATTSGTALTHVTTADELAQAGTYRLQARFTLGGWTGRGETCELAIYDTFA